MKIEELSVGDWVQAKLAKWDYDSPDETEPMRIVCIDNSEPKQAFADMIGVGMVKHSALIDDLHPIPLTPEILEKNGFKFDFGTWFYMNSNFELSIYRGEWYQTVAGDEYRLYPIKYVHQLQRAMNLAGIEKEIIL